MPTLTPQDFVSKNAREKRVYQEHFLDLWQLAGHRTPNDYDDTGAAKGHVSQDLWREPREIEAR